MDRLKTAATSIVAMVFLSVSAHASTPDSWANLDQRVNRACIAMSGLPRPQVLAQKISFSDAIGTEIRLVRGTDSKGRFRRMLCAFDRKTSRTEVKEVGGWFGSAAKP